MLGAQNGHEICGKAHAIREVFTSTIFNALASKPKISWGALDDFRDIDMLI